MTAPISMPVPAPDEVIFSVRNGDDLIDAFRKIKDQLGLSNRECDDLGNLVHGHTDKVLGPTRVKNIGPHVFGVLCWLFAVKFEMKIDLDQARTMAEHWVDRQRNTSNVREGSGRVSKVILQRAAPIVFRDAGKRGAAQRQSKLTPELRSQIASKAGRARMQNVTKEQRSAMNRKGWQTRRKAKALVIVDQP